MTDPTQLRRYPTGLARSVPHPSTAASNRPTGDDRTSRASAWRELRRFLRSRRPGPAEAFAFVSDPRTPPGRGVPGRHPPTARPRRRHHTRPTLRRRRGCHHALTGYYPGRPDARRAARQAQVPVVHTTCDRNCAAHHNNPPGWSADRRHRPGLFGPRPSRWGPAMSTAAVDDDGTDSGRAQQGSRPSSGRGCTHRRDHYAPAGGTALTRERVSGLLQLHQRLSRPGCESAAPVSPGGGMVGFGSAKATQTVGDRDGRAGSMGQRPQTDQTKGPLPHCTT